MTGREKRKEKREKGPAAELLFSFLFYLFSFAFAVDPEKT